MKIWTISDTHCRHNELIVPDVDMVIHCGDCSNSFLPADNEKEVYNFLDWYSELPIKHKLMTFGNHDTSVEAGLIDLTKYPNINFLHQSGVTIEDIKFWGSPYTPRFGSWAFMIKRNRMEMVWDNVPDDTDVLVTHGPPKGFLDLTKELDGSLVQVGCKSLTNATSRIKPLVHCFGHIHDESDIYNYGILQREERYIINAACLNHRSGNFHMGHILEIKVGK